MIKFFGFIFGFILGFVTLYVLAANYDEKKPTEQEKKESRISHYGKHILTVIFPISIYQATSSRTRSRMPFAFRPKESLATYRKQSRISPKKN